MYREACKEWQQKANSDKTWQIFKRHFAADYHEIRKQQRLSWEAGFNSSHLSHKTTDMATAIDNLSIAATAYRNIVVDFISINKILVETNVTLVALTSKSVAEHLTKPITIRKGHINKMQNNVQSTQSSVQELPEPEVEQLEHPTHILFASIKPIGRVYTVKPGGCP